MGTVMPLEFLNLGSGDGESELGLGCLRADPCLLLSHCLATEGSVKTVEVPVKTGVCVCKALHEDHPLPRGLSLRGLSLEGLMAELDIRCSSGRQKSTFSFNYTLRQKSNLKLLACFAFSVL